MIQGETVRALGALGAVETVPALLNLLIDDELYGPRSNIYRAVTDASQIFGGITELLKSESGLTRSAAVLTLPWYSDEGSLNTLEPAMRDPNEMVRKAGTWAFHALQKVILYRKQSGL